MAIIVISFIGFKTTNASIALFSTPAVGLQAHWTFDNRDINWSSNEVFDTSGNGNIGTTTNMSQSANQVAGKIGQAAYFDGNITYISLASNPIASTSNPSSMCAWVKTDDITSNTGGWNETFLNLYTNSNNGIRVGSVVNTGSLFVVYKHNGIDSGAQTVANVFTNHAWAYVCYVWSGSNLSLYSNGNSMATTSNVDFVGAANTIGARDDLADGTWLGSVDDMRIYSRALSATEVLRLYQGGATILHSSSGHKVTLGTDDPGRGSTLVNGLVGWWTFNGQDTNWTAMTTADKSGNGNTGTMVGMSTSTSPVQGKIGQALYFTGFTNRISLPSITLSADFSISMWIKLTCVSSACSANNYHTLLAQEIGYNGLYFMDDDHLQYYGGNGTETAGTIPLNAWTHVVLVSASGAGAYYINGIADSNTVSTVAMSGALSIGGDTYAGGAGNVGAIDDVRIYDRALSASEVRQLYYSGI
ncbi:MAG: LamG domain-containing protein [Patescibacteria group bacterium]|nr:LamG domain-containing protein [Patescibacteria group bacterium]